jgi:hypothetical protein
MCETNPIWPGGPGMGAGVSRAKQSQLVAEGPGRPSPRPWALRLPPGTRSKHAKQTQFRGVGWPGSQGGCTNKPNWAGRVRGPECEMRKTNPISGRQDTQHSTIPAFQRSSPMPFVRNKANLVRASRNGRGRPGDPAGERLCETKPICSE